MFFWGSESTQDKYIVTDFNNAGVGEVNDIGLSGRGYRPQSGERSMTKAEWKAQQQEARIRSNLAKRSPVEIPDNATIKIQQKNGYSQIRFTWKEDTGNGVNWNVRWHTETPRAPIGTGNTWSVDRKINGTSGTQSVKQQLLNDGTWYPLGLYKTAGVEWQKGTATPQQAEILSKGHFQDR